MSRGKNPFSILHPVAISKLLIETNQQGGTLNTLLTRLESWKWEQEEIRQNLTVPYVNQSGSVFTGPDLKAKLSQRIGAVRNTMSQNLETLIVEEAEKAFGVPSHQFTNEQMGKAQNMLNEAVERLYPTFDKRDRQSGEVKHQCLNHLKEQLKGLSIVFTK